MNEEPTTAFIQRLADLHPGTSREPPPPGDTPLT
jgi:hypothetical protein